MSKKVDKAESAKSEAPKSKIPPRLKELYRTQMTQKIREQLGITNLLAMPRLQKITVTVGLGKQLEGTKLNPKAKETVLNDLAVITGQKAVVTKAKKSVSNFKVRKGFEVGAMVTLRGDRMWEFFDRLMSMAIPRIKDFRGLNPKSFDGRGNYSFGVNEQGIFPEIDMAKTDFSHGMNITFAFSNSSDDKSRFVLAEMGLPFAKPGGQN